MKNTDPNERICGCCGSGKSAGLPHLIAMLEQREKLVAQAEAKEEPGAASSIAASIELKKKGTISKQNADSTFIKINEDELRK